MNRNVLNTGVVDGFLAAIGEPDDSRAIRAWLERVARRWILREFPAVGRIVRVRPMAVANCGRVDIRWAEGADSRGETSRLSALPDWLEAALPDGVHWLDMAGPSARELAARLNAVATYFRELEGDPRPGRLERMALPDAVAAAMRFRRATRRPDSAACRNTLMAFDDGYRVVLLSSARELAREGARMAHCVDVYEEELELGVDILSLRDPKDRPHVTIEVRGGRAVHQIKGKANMPVAPRYRPYVIDFIHEMGLLVKGDRANVGLTYRPFEPGAGHGWAAQGGLGAMIRDDIAGRLVAGDELDTFYEDAQAVLDTMSEAAWAWFVELFRGPGGEFVWLQPGRRFEVGGARFALVELRFPLRLYWLLRDHGRSVRSRALRRALLDRLAGLLFRFCRRDDSALLQTDGCEHLAGIDFRRLRHQHQERLRRRLAAARRGLRRQPAAPRRPYAELARWEDQRRAFARCLQGELGHFL